MGETRPDTTVGDGDDAALALLASAAASRVRLGPSSHPLQLHAYLNGTSQSPSTLIRTWNMMQADWSDIVATG